jgi:hypothetical protein
MALSRPVLRPVSFGIGDCCFSAPLLPGVKMSWWPGRDLLVLAGLFSWENLISRVPLVLGWIPVAFGAWGPINRGGPAHDR